MLAESLLSVTFFFGGFRGVDARVRWGFCMRYVPVCFCWRVRRRMEEVTFAVAARSSRDKSAWARIGIGIPLLLSVLIDLSATMMP